MHPSRCFLILALSVGCTALLPLPLYATATPFTIRWTAPGDDGTIGRATSYEMRYSTSPITAANYQAATRLVGLPPPGVAGTAQSYVVTGFDDAIPYYFALRTMDEAGNVSGISNVIERLAKTAGVDSGVLAFAFAAPWPNPARAAVQCSFALPHAARIEVDVFDATGRKVRRLAEGERAAGEGELAWDLRDESGRRVAPGLYLVQAALGETHWTRRVTVIR